MYGKRKYNQAGDKTVEYQKYLMASRFDAYLNQIETIYDASVKANKGMLGGCFRLVENYESGVVSFETLRYIVDQCQPIKLLPMPFGELDNIIYDTEIRQFDIDFIRSTWHGKSVGNGIFLFTSSICKQPKIAVELSIFPIKSWSDYEENDIVSISVDLVKADSWESIR